MFSFVCNAVVVFLTIVGLVEIVRMIILALLKINCDNDTWQVIPLSGHNEKAEMLLRSAATKVEWSFGMKRHKVICLDVGMDDETRLICEIICSEYNFMKICTQDEFIDMMISS
mgnify:CR=1 FL=1